MDVRMVNPLQPIPKRLREIQAYNSSQVSRICAHHVRLARGRKRTPVFSCPPFFRFCPRPWVVVTVDVVAGVPI